MSDARITLKNIWMKRQMRQMETFDISGRKTFLLKSAQIAHIARFWYLLSYCVCVFQTVAEQTGSAARLPVQCTWLYLIDLSFPGECGTILPGQTFHQWEKEGRGSELSGREFWVIRSSPKESLPQIPFCRLMLLLYRDV